MLDTHDPDILCGHFWFEDFWKKTMPFHNAHYSYSCPPSSLIPCQLLNCRYRIKKIICRLTKCKRVILCREYRGYESYLGKKSLEKKFPEKSPKILHWKSLVEKSPVIKKSPEIKSYQFETLFSRIFFLVPAWFYTKKSSENKSSNKWKCMIHNGKIVGFLGLDI